MTSSAAPDRRDATGGPPAEESRRRPGWIEIGAAAIGYVVLVAVGAVGLRAIPDGELAAAGLAAYALSAVAGLGAFAAAVAVRIRDLGAFGIRRVPARWLLAGAGFGLLGFLLSILAAGAVSIISGDTQDVQTSYKAAAGGGVLSLIATLLLGAIATPIGEEAAFRGVLTNALGRYGPWVSVLGSATVFAVAHGVNLVLPVAFINGVITALLFRRTGSIWPGVMVHLVNNTLATLVPLFLPG